MHSDSVFTIGSSHQVCQDYVQVKNESNECAVWLADGCSTAPNTDCGARLLVHKALLHESLAWAEFEAEEFDLPNFFTTVAREARFTCDQLGLPDMSLDATLLGILARDGKYRAVCHGDGMIVLGREDGGLHIYDFSYDHGYPYYLNYRNDEARLADFEKLAGKECHITSTVVSPSGDIIKFDALHQTPMGVGGLISDMKFAMILSDGIHSFRKPKKENPRLFDAVDYLEILKGLAAVKNWTGEFLKRRAGKMLKEFASKQYDHYDDFSVGMMVFDSE